MRTTPLWLVLALLPTAAASIDVRVDPGVDLRVEARVEADLDVGPRERGDSEVASEEAGGGTFRDRCARALARLGAGIGPGGSGLALGAAGGLWVALAVGRRLVLGA